MRRHHTGTGRRTAVPAGWGRAHATAAAGTRTATVTLSTPASSSHWDDVAEQTVVDPATTYASSVSARIQALVNRSDTEALVAEESVPRPPYLVTVDHDLQPHEGDEVTVTATDDPLLLNRVLRVDQVLLGSERFERDLLCTLVDDTTPPT